MHRRSEETPCPDWAGSGLEVMRCSGAGVRTGSEARLEQQAVLLCWPRARHSECASWRHPPVGTAAWTGMLAPIASASSVAIAQLGMLGGTMRAPVRPGQVARTLAG